MTTTITHTHNNATDVIVVINCGSSSVKLDAFDMHAQRCMLSAIAERVGTAQARVVVDGVAGPPAQMNHHSAIHALLDGVEARGCVVRAVGHRVVHGGDAFTTSCLITSGVVDAIAACVPLAPLHNPANLQGIEVARARLSVPQVAVFDTAFHTTMKPHAFLYALPQRFHTEQHVRRYGFHGTSHRYVSARAAVVLGKPLSSLKLVTVHLGNGCSACAVDGGASADTTMGMTPLEGLMMGTRSGDLDPAVVLKLARELGADAAETLLNKQAGLLGVSGLSQDMRDLLEAADNPQHAHANAARVAIDMFVHRVRKSIGALACGMGGLDAVVFTGGIGEHAVGVRAAICEGLSVLGASLDPSRNHHARGDEQDIATAASKVRLLVIPTDEERAIAQDVRALL
jgi:acetate kinase